MSSQSPVLEITATYYKPSVKKWFPGIFTLNENSLQFQADKPNDECKLLIPLSAIGNMEKRQSSFVYPALVITISSEKHWFGSLANRDAVYNLIELFWRESLLSKTKRKTAHKYREGSTLLGKELLSILQESENSLVDAANALSSQGRQIEESQLMMEDINSDLDTAEKYLKNMSFSGAVLKLKETDTPVSLNAEQSQQEPPLLKAFKVTFSDKSGDICEYKRGSIVIADKVVIVDQEWDVKIEINKENVEKLLVVSPWAFNLEYSNDWSTLIIYFVCPQLSSLLKFVKLIPALKDKIVYESVPEMTEEPSTSTNTETKTVTPREPTSSMANINKVVEQLQTQEDNSNITNDEMKQITNILHNLKALATEVSREQHDQLEKINELISEVDETELRMNQDNKKIKKYL